MDITEWKKVYQTISGLSSVTTPKIVSDVLDKVKNKIVKGLLSYKPYKKNEYEIWVKNCNLSESLKHFVNELAQYLDLECNTAYAIMTNYLMLEYYGKIKEFWHILRHGAANRLKENICSYYTSERMFLLKSLRHIFECVENSENKFAALYQRFLDTIDFIVLQNNLIEQYKLVGKDLPNCADKNHLRNLLCRNHREQIEILFNFILSVNYKTPNEDQFGELVNIFFQRRFTILPCVEHIQYCNKNDLNDLMSAQVACYLVLLQQLDSRETYCYWLKESFDVTDIYGVNISERLQHTYVLLAWILLKAKMSEISVRAEHEMVIDLLLNKKPFYIINSVVKNQMFKNCKVGEVVMKSVHELVDSLCLMFTDRKLLYCEGGLVSIAIECLKQDSLTEICLRKRDSMDIIYHLTLEAFPYDFNSFSNVLCILLSKKSHQKTGLNLLKEVSYFLSEMPWKMSEPANADGDGTAVLETSLPNFPLPTEVASYPIFGRNLVQYKLNYPYFVYFESMLDKVGYYCKNHIDINIKLINKVISGFNVVIEIIKHCSDSDFEELQVEKCTKKLETNLCNFSHNYFNKDLMILYFQIHNAMIIYKKRSFIDHCSDVFIKFVMLRIKYVLSECDEISSIFNQNIFTDTVLLHYLEKEELTDNHNLVEIFLEILQSLIEHSSDCSYFQVVGFLYLIHFVFWRHTTWVYKDSHQLIRITILCFKIMHYILANKFDEKPNKYYKMMYNICRHSLLKKDSIVHVFCQLLVKKRHYLIFVMERESNWINGPTLNELECLRIQLSILLIISNFNEDIRDSLFENKLQYLTKLVASFLINSYSPVLAQLSCRFLVKLATNKDIPLLTWMEFDHYQVQVLFLEKLRDPLIEENIKIAIIDLINKCVLNQDGMTAAFFNLKCFMYWDSDEMDKDSYPGETVATFLVDYLRNLTISHEYLNNPLQLGILKLFCNLWIHSRKKLIVDVIELENFWPIMFDPLLLEFNLNPEVYALIIKIVNSEILDAGENVDMKLGEIVYKFVTDVEIFNKFLDFVEKSMKSFNRENVELINTFIEFILILKKFCPDILSEDVRNSIYSICLRALTTADINQDFDITYIWVKFYLLLIRSWPIYSNTEIFTIDKLTLILKVLTTFYSLVPLPIKEIFMCIIQTIVISMRSYFETNTNMLKQFLYFVSDIIENEYGMLLNNLYHETDDARAKDLSKCWAIIVSMGDHLLSYENVDEISLWFIYTKFLEKVMQSIKILLKFKSTMPFAQVAINHLIVYANSPLVNHFLQTDLFKFYYQLHSPELIISVGDAILFGFPIILKEWWFTFVLIMKFNRVLITNLGVRSLEFIYSFLTKHDQTVLKILNLNKYTLDVIALCLVVETLKFLHAFFKLKKNWSTYSEHSYQKLLDNILTCLNCCILSILGSKKINFYHIINEKLEVINHDPLDLLTGVINKLIEIFSCGLDCLRVVSPDLIQLLHNDFQRDVKLFIANDFSLPKFELPVLADLTYGRMLCFAHYLCKTYTRLSFEMETEKPTFIKTIRENIAHSKDCGELRSVLKLYESYKSSHKKTTAFMVYIQKTDDVIHSDQLYSFLHDDMSPHSVANTKVIQFLNFDLVKSTLEKLMAFMCGEIYLSSKIAVKDVPLFKRELYSELQFYFEFVRKLTTVQYAQIISSKKTITGLSHITDMIQRYTMMNLKDDPEFIVDQNFFLVLAQWMTKVCDLTD